MSHLRKKTESDKVRDHCHLTGKNRGPAHIICNINATQQQRNFVSYISHKFRNYDCHMFLKKLVDEKNDKVNFDLLPKKNEEYISATYRGIRFIDSYRFLSSSFDSLVETLVDKSEITLKNLRQKTVDNDERKKIVKEIKEENKTSIDLKKVIQIKMKI